MAVKKNIPDPSRREYLDTLVDQIAERLGVDSENVQVDYRADQVCLAAADAKTLLDGQETTKTGSPAYLDYLNARYDGVLAQIVADLHDLANDIARVGVRRDTPSTTALDSAIAVLHKIDSARTTLGTDLLIRHAGDLIRHAGDAS